MKYICFEQTLTDTIPLLKSYAWKLTKNGLKAEDLLQETLCKALHKKHLYKNHNNFKGWVMTIMRNVFINDYNRHQYRHTISFEDTLLPATQHTAADNACNVAGLKYISHIISQLPKAMKCSLLLYARGYQYDEIAGMLKEPIGTVKSRIFLARKRIARLRDEVL
ncbi:MAG: RNA polymerase sigma factor [Filimonas sp.]|nr:RNA polymerase sigma factor [Filimonas sp.]